MQDDPTSCEHHPETKKMVTLHKDGDNILLNVSVNQSTFRSEERNPLEP